MMKKWLILLTACSATGVMADVFGTGADEFEMTFEQISSDSNPSSGFGIVDYHYGIGTHEITADQWNKYRNVIGWHEAAQFMNWLNTNQGHQAACNYIGGKLNAWDASDRPTHNRLRGGAYNSHSPLIGAFHAGDQRMEDIHMGFHVATIPEPTDIVLFGLFGTVILALRRIFMG